jgi:hypothetical protein
MSNRKSKKLDWELIEDKLDEARFFLDHLHDEKAKQARPNKPPPAPFRPYLSAFMTAARTVTDLIERGGKQAWRKQLNATERALHDFAKKMRGDNVHKGRIETIPRAEEVPVHFSPDAYQLGNVHLRAQALALYGNGSVTTVAETHYVEMNNEKRDVVTVCDEYVDLLTKIVAQTKPDGP